MMRPPLPGWIAGTVVLVASVVGVALNLYAFIVPLFGIFGGGVVAGFLCGYVLEPRSSFPNGLVVGLVCGTVAGGIVAIGGSALGMFFEPPTLGLHVVGLVTPVFEGESLVELLAIAAAITGLVTADVLVGVCVGSVVRFVRNLV